MKFTVICIALGVITAAGLVQGEEIPEGFIKRAQALLLRGELDAAVDQYARAFILDPQNKGTLRQMLSLNSHERLSTSKRMKLSMLHGRIRQLNRLHEAIEIYAQKKLELTSDLTRRGVDIELLGLEMTLIEKDAQARRARQLEASRELFLEGDDPLDLVAATLQQTQISLNSDLEQLQEQMERLKDFTQQNGPPMTERLNEQDIEHLRRAGEIFSANIPNTGLLRQDLSGAGQNEIASLSLQLHETRRQLQEQDRQIRMLMASMQELKEGQDHREGLLDEKNQEITRLNESLVDLQSQLILRERIVREKEENIDRIREERSGSSLGLIEDNKRLKKQLQAQQRDVRQLEALLSVYQEGLSFREGKTQGADRPRRGRDDLPAAFDPSKEEARVLSMFNDQDKKINEREEQLAELKNIIQMYKMLLNEAKKGQKDAQVQLTQSHADVERLNNTLLIKGKTLMDAEYKLLNMKKELTAVQTRFMAFKSLPLTKDYAKMEQEMLFIEGELKNIHTFLLNQLDDFEKLNNDFVAGGIKDVDRVLQLDIERIQEDYSATQNQ